MQSDQRGDPQELPAEVREALERGQVIEAIRRLRAERNVDLKEARDLIHAQARHRSVPQHPQLESMIQEDRSSPRLLIVLVLLAIAMAIYWFAQ